MLLKKHEYAAYIQNVHWTDQGDWFSASLIGICIGYLLFHLVQTKIKEVHKIFIIDMACCMLYKAKPNNGK